MNWYLSKPMVERVGPVAGKQNGDKCDVSIRLSRADSLIDDSLQL